MKVRKVFAIFVALAMVLGSVSMSFAATDATTPDATATDSSAGTTVTEEAASPAAIAVFTDTAEHWAKDAVAKWSGYGIVKGYEGLFRPDDSITRGEMAIILDNMMDYQVVAKNTFTDLPAGQYYTEAVLKANAAGIMKGDGATVRPNDKITREEAAIMMSRAFGVAGADSTKGFLDATSVSDWAKSAVFGMEAKGYINGYNGNFQPKANISRAAVVTMIDNIVKAYYTASGTYTDKVEGTAVIKVSDVTLKGITITGNLIIAEGVGKGDATLDSITVTGDTIVRGGGENSVHITGTSSITSIKIEKVGDKLRVVVSDGSKVTSMEVDVAEDIVITGTVAKLEVNAPNAVIEATDANIENATIASENATLKVGEKSVIGTVNVASTAKKANIETATGAKVTNVTAAAEVKVSGTGTVSNVTLNKGADGSAITTPKTVTTVNAGVSGATGGGGISIPERSTGTNSSDGSSATTTPTSSSGNSGGGNGSSGTTTPTVNHPDLELKNLTYLGNAVASPDGVYQVSASALTASTEAIGVTVYGNGFDPTKVYSITVTVNRTAPNAASKTETINNLPGALLNQTHADTYNGIAGVLDYFTNTLSALTGSANVNSFTPFLSTQGAGAAYTVTFTYSTTGQSGQLDGGVFKFELK